jgi:uncharacterized cupredoxin-like copper-binding protein
MMTMRRMAAGALVLGLAVGATACGSDDNETASDTPTTAVDQAACDAAIDVSSLFNEAPQDPDAIKGYAADTLVPAAQKLAAALPAELADAGKAIESTFRGVATTGDPSGIESKEYAEATTATGKMVHERCGLKAVDVVAKDYLFADLPADLAAGRTSFALDNQGKEMHEIVLFKKADGETRTWDELSQLPQEEQGKVMQFSGVAFGDAGSTAYTTVDLQAGTYIAVCTMPVGGHEDGEPHFMKGMVQEITVS